MIALGVIAHNKAWLIEEQIRLLAKHLTDDYTLTVFDNSSDRDAAREIETLFAPIPVPDGWEVTTLGKCASATYERLTTPDWRHDHALNVAAKRLLASDADYIGFLDHDVVPTEPTSLISLVEPAGFYGVGQRHGPTDSLYIWPGFFSIRRSWLESKAPRTLNFGGIRGNEKADDGDCGSMNAALFSDEDWRNVFTGRHGYQALRPPNGEGLQSWGVEWVSDSWLHLTNGSGWMAVTDWDERERLCRELLAKL